MPRLTRLDAPGVLHHVIIRGIEQHRIFADDLDRLDFTERLSRLVPETECACYAWVLMDNHAHFLFRSGPAGLAGLMRRLLTGYAVSFNRRHKRHGQLFQNRYKSVICQEDAYLKELVRYIHLNPLRAGITSDLAALQRHRFCGHAVLMGKQACPWQDDRYVLNIFSDSLPDARRRYLVYMQAGIGQGRRPELVGGGMVRSLGGWAAVKNLRASGMDRVKGDQRILGPSDFVQAILAQADENFERTYALKRQGIDLAAAAAKAASLFHIEPAELFIRSRIKPRADARGLYCYWGVRELGVSLTALAEQLHLTPPAVSYAVQRGERLARENGYKLT